MDTARISVLLAPFLDRPLPGETLQQISIYIDLLLRWNSRINLTAIRDRESIVTRHFGESFFLARHLLPVEEPAASDGVEDGLARGVGRSSAGICRVVDIGSGAGFPGLPLKIWAPGIHLTLIESNHKKAAFLREAARELTLTNIDVITARAETLTSRAGFPTADLVTLRAVERFDTIVPLAARFVSPSGRLALLIGSSQLQTLPTLVPGLLWQPGIPIPASSSRVIAIGSR